MAPADDSAARERALDPLTSFAVRAPAGSGKTSLLTQRLLRLLVTVEQPEQVVAITFTRKAAEEMRNRVIRALAAADGEPPTEPFARRTFDLARAVKAHDAARGWGLAGQPTRLRIMTIDALCQSLVRRMPLSAGVFGQLAIEDEPAALYRQAGRQALAAIAGRDGFEAAARTVLEHLDNNWQRLEGLLSNMLAVRDQWQRSIGGGAEREVFEQALAHAVTMRITRVRDALTADERGALARLAAWSGENVDGSALAGLAELPPASADHVAAWREIAALFVTRDGSLRKRINKTNGFPAGSGRPQEMKDHWQAFVDGLAGRAQIERALHEVSQLPQARFSDGEWRAIEALTVLLHLAAGHFMVLCEQRGATDYTALSMAAEQALGADEAPTELALRLDYEIRHLLIDEFQDTSVTQFRLVRQLTAGWVAGDGRTIFVVGDPMQSIYRFRQADVSRFQRVMSEACIGDVPVETLPLTTNFRSQAALVDWINSAMPHALDAVAAPLTWFAPQQPVHPALDEAVHVHAQVGRDDAAEARALCAVIDDLRARETDASVAVLVRSRGHLGLLTAALIEAGHAVSAREIRPFGDIPSVNDLHALCRALLHPGDRIAWLALLRAPWCGADLTALHTLAGDDALPGERLVDDAVLATLDAATRTAVARVGNVMAQALAALAARPFVQVLEWCWLQLGGPAVYPGPQAMRDTTAYLDIVARLGQGDEPLAVSDIEARLERRYSSPAAAEPGAIQIMTIHAAKGLEFDHVLLPGAGRAPRHDARELLVWREEPDEYGGDNLLVAPIPRGTDGPRYDFVRRLEKADADAESVRLLYVALTRARRSVHLFAHARADTNGQPVTEKGTFARLLWSVIGAHFDANEANDAPTTPATVTAPGGIRRARPGELPAVAAPHDDSSAAALPAPVEFDWAGVAARHIGTVTHRLLQALAEQGWPDDETGWVERALAWSRGRLRGLGVAGDRLDGACERIRVALTTTLASERGRWLFAGDHADVRSEWRLAATVPGTTVGGRAVIDRSFIDGDGVRWIVDYKTGSHRGGGVDAWLDSEVERYRPQLDRYAAVVALGEDRPVRLGLYFPLLDAWREWPHAPCA